jgi:hypothetical protein
MKYYHYSYEMPCLISFSREVGEYPFEVFPSPNLDGHDHSCLADRQVRGKPVMPDVQDVRPKRSNDLRNRMKFSGGVVQSHLEDTDPSARHESLADDPVDHRKIDVSAG